MKDYKLSELKDICEKYCIKGNGCIAEECPISEICNELEICYF